MTNCAASDVMPDALPSSIDRAWQARCALHDEAAGVDASQDAYRIFHGHHDGLRGLDIDRLGTSCLVSLKQGLSRYVDAIVMGIASCHGFERIVLRMHARHNPNPRPLSITTLQGEAPQGPIEVRDNGMRFVIDLEADANPGLFLDARPARRWLLGHSRGRRVLNLFAFTGSLGVAAAVGGAASVTHVDWNWSSLAVAQANHAINGVPIEERDLMRGDLYYHLPRAAKAGKSFDAIILDPPPEMPRSKRGHARGQDYPRLTRLATSLLAPGAWLLCFFHGYEMTRKTFEDQVLEASRCDLEVLWRGTSGDDFPEHDPEKKLRLTVFQRPQD